MTGRAMSGQGGNGRRIVAWGALASLMLVPWVAMKFTKEVNWTGSDFVVFAGMLTGVGIIYELLTWKGGRFSYRAGIAVALAAAILLFWVTGAVGIIGSEGNVANLMYAGVLAVGLLGAVIARLRAGGMALALVATAVAQGLVAVIALTGKMGAGDASWPWDIVGSTVVFAGMWLVSAGLFARAARG